jgi:predicted acylesterase/phospholipase RssA
MANLEPLAGELVSEDAMRRLFAALVPVTAWPEKRLMITAVDAESGHRVYFEAGSGVDLLDAVRASCAVPGMYPLVSIDGRRYADGGPRSAFNAELAAGSREVTILSPLQSNPYLKGCSRPKLRRSVMRPCTSSWPTRARWRRSAPTWPRRTPCRQRSRRASHKLRASGTRSPQPGAETSVSHPPAFAVAQSTTARA